MNKEQVAHLWGLVFKILRWFSYMIAFFVCYKVLEKVEQALILNAPAI